MFNKQLTKIAFGFVMIAMLTSGNVQAGDAKAGEAKSMVCAGCHGSNGISLSPDIPNLAGQKEMYLAKAIEYYKSGERKSPMMSAMVGSLSEEDMANLAAYFSSLKP